MTPLSVSIKVSKSGAGRGSEIHPIQALMPKLIVQLPDREWIVDLQDGTNMVGRSSKCQVPVPDTNISREHCEVFVASGGATLIDKGSMNGTLLNGQRIWERKLQVGDKIQIGQTVLWFETKTAGADPAPQPVAGDSKTRTRRNVEPPPSNPTGGTKKRTAASALIKDYAAWSRPRFNWPRWAVVGVLLVLLGGAVVLLVQLPLKKDPEVVEDRDNLFQEDPSFERSQPGRPATWTLRPTGNSTALVSPATARSGKHSLEINASGSPSESIFDVEHAAKFPTGGTQAYEVSAWAKWASFAGTAALKVAWLQGATILFEETSPSRAKSADWAELKDLFSVPPGADSFRVSVSLSGRGAGLLYLDDVRIAAAAGPAWRGVSVGGAVVSKGGVVAVREGTRVLISNLHLRLENDREGATSQLASPAEVRVEGEGRALVSGTLSHPVGGASVAYKLSVDASKKGEVWVVYEIATADLKQIDRLALVSAVPRAERLPADPVARWELNGYAFDFPGEIRLSMREGHRLIQSFPTTGKGPSVRAGFRLRELSADDDVKDPRAAASKLAANQPGRAWAILRAAKDQNGHGEAVAKDIASRIRELELQEAAEWREAESAALVAELLATAPLLDSAGAELAKYTQRWTGDPFESKAASLASRLAAASGGKVEVDRDARLVERARECFEGGRRALAEAILAGVLFAYPGTEAAEEAQRLLRQIRAGG